MHRIRSEEIEKVVATNVHFFLHVDKLPLISRGHHAVYVQTPHGEAKASKKVLISWTRSYWLPKFRFGTVGTSGKIEKKRLHVNWYM